MKMPVDFFDFGVEIDYARLSFAFSNISNYIHITISSNISLPFVCVLQQLLVGYPDSALTN